MKNAVGRFVGFLRANWLVLLLASLLIIVLGWGLYQLQTSRVLALSVGKLATNNELLVQEMDAQNVVISQLNQEKSDLEETVARAEQLVQQMVPVNQIYWCTNMSPEAMPAQYAAWAQLVLNYVAALPTEVRPSRFCVDIWSIFGSPQTGEVYISVSREFPGGAGERFIVYLEPVPGNPDYLWVGGHFNIITREFFTIVHEEAPPQPEVEEPAQSGE